MVEDRQPCRHGSYHIPGEPHQCLRCRIDALKAENERLHEAQQWVSVDDRLPENLPKSVLIYSVRGMEVCGGDYVCDNYPYKFHDAITHWMPLPPPPEALEDKGDE